MGVMDRTLRWEVVGETHADHLCGICGDVIPRGSRGVSTETISTVEKEGERTYTAYYCYGCESSDSGDLSFSQVGGRIAPAAKRVFGSLDENWCAFCLAILFHERLSPEEAFYRLASKKQAKTNRWVRSADVDNDLIEMREMRRRKMTYSQIGEAFGLSKAAVFKRIQRGCRVCQQTGDIIDTDDDGGLNDGESEEETGG